MNESLSLLLESLIQKAHVKILNKGNRIRTMKKQSRNAIIQQRRNPNPVCGRRKKEGP